MTSPRHAIGVLLVGHSLSLVALYFIANPADSLRTFRTVTVIRRHLPDLVATVFTPGSVAAILCVWLVGTCVWLAGELDGGQRWRPPAITASACFALAIAGSLSADSSVEEVATVLTATAIGTGLGTAATFRSRLLSLRRERDSLRRWTRHVRRYRRSVIILTAVFVVCALAGAPIYVFPTEHQPARHTDAVVVLGPADDKRITAGITAAQEVGSPIVAISSSLAPDGGFASPQCSEAAPVHVVCFVAKPFSTAGEMSVLNEISAAREWTEVLLLTATPHVTRANLIADRCLTAHAVVRSIDVPGSLSDWILAYLYQTSAFVKIVATGPCA